MEQYAWILEACDMKETRHFKQMHDPVLMKLWKMQNHNDQKQW